MILNQFKNHTIGLRQPLERSPNQAPYEFIGNDAQLGCITKRNFERCGGNLNDKALNKSRGTL